MLDDNEAISILRKRDLLRKEPLAKFNGVPYSLAWMVLWHAQCHLYGYDMGLRHREYEGSAAKALCFPYSKQPQIKLSRGQRDKLARKGSKAISKPVAASGTPGGTEVAPKASQTTVGLGNGHSRGTEL